MDQGLILKKPIISEKSLEASGFREYTFMVDKKARKREIAKAVEEVFGVKVEKVKTMIVKGKTRRAMRTRKRYRLPDFKKAIVRVAEGQKIDIFETGKREEKK